MRLRFRLRLCRGGARESVEKRHRREALGVPGKLSHQPAERFVALLARLRGV